MLLDALVRDGYALLPGALGIEEVDRLEAALRHWESVPDTALPPHCPRSRTPALDEVRHLGVLELGEPFEALIDHPVFEPWIAALVKGPARLTCAQSITRRNGLGLPLHHIESARWWEDPDGPHCDHLTMVVWLSDVGPDDGPMVVFDGSHRWREFPYARFHPDWPVPEHDLEFYLELLGRQPGLEARPWERIPGYRELHVRRGDVVVFAETLWHGAREVRSGRTRRSLYLSFSPYHFGNWHGLGGSDELRARLDPRRRARIAGPFIGTRYAVWPVPDVPDRPEFPTLAESERAASAARNGDPTRDPRVLAGLARGLLASHLDRAELSGVNGCLRLCVSGEAGWDLAVTDGHLRIERPGASSADALLSIELEDLVGLLEQRLDPVTLFQEGRGEVRGEMRLVMRLASLLFRPHMG